MNDTRMRELYEGHIPLDEALASIELSAYQKVEIRVLMALVSIVRPVYWGVRRLLGRPFAVTEGLDELRELPTPTRGSRTQESDGADYLSEEQIATYERGPLPTSAFSKVSPRSRTGYLLSHDRARISR